MKYYVRGKKIYINNRKMYYFAIDIYPQFRIELTIYDRVVNSFKKQF